MKARRDLPSPVHSSIKKLPIFRIWLNSPTVVATSLSSSLLVVVARLLPELLLQIFRVVRDEEPPYQYRRMSYQAPPRFHLGWIRLTQVCQRWRQVWHMSAFFSVVSHDIKNNRWL
ncbi:hypothetical protein OF83DRAFT_30339 [Amylostereum chailletii]|nr:hypothetical protein OF83DRAFT_30339 [Amylostereum chailletii]